MVEGLKKTFEVADGLWRNGASRARPGEIACRTGCFGCCVGLFEITLAEAVLARDGFRKLPEAERAEVAGRARAIVDSTASSFPGDARLGVLDPERSERQDDAYFEAVADSACPFLELPSGRCRIYASRPVTCRTYGLAWTRQGDVVHPPCVLNLPGLPAARHVETGVDLDRLIISDALALEAARRAGLPAGAETTLAHALVGDAFAGV